MPGATIPVNLEVEHLRKLRAVWEKGDPDDELVDAVRALFHGQDGTLPVVNAALQQCRPSQLMANDIVVATHGDWALVENPHKDRYVSHVGHPVGWPAIDYDIEATRLGENWERQLGEKSWMSDQSKADLAAALADARQRWA